MPDTLLCPNERCLRFAGAYRALPSAVVNSEPQQSPAKAFLGEQPLVTIRSLRPQRTDAEAALHRRLVSCAYRMVETALLTIFQQTFAWGGMW